ncbi:cytochrome oxidase assembly factor [Gautieria morchelliformis]|nr:cytochrome oxidase assembly factor [Gautieria morchelliformis]
MYTTSVIVISLGLSYAFVPLYRAFCSATGFGGTPMTGKGKFEPERLVPVTGAKRIKVHFNADTSDALPWSFTPQQKFIYVLPGETALAFYTAKNKSDKDIVGIATYNVAPDKIAPYFAKVECFCFEEQKLLAGEEVDLPLFFFIDKDYAEDRSMAELDDIVLSYTFFRARRNKHGHLEPDANEDVVDKSMGWTKYPKAEPRDQSET